MGEAAGKHESVTINMSSQDGRLQHWLLSIARLIEADPARYNPKGDAANRPQNAFVG